MGWLSFLFSFLLCPVLSAPTLQTQVEMLQQRPLVHCTCPCRLDTRLRALIGEHVAGRATALKDSRPTTARAHRFCRRRSRANVKPLAPAARPFRLIVGLGPLWSVLVTRLLARLQLSTFPDCCCWAFWEAAPAGTAAPPLLPFCRFALGLCLWLVLFESDCAPVGSFPDLYHRRACRP